MGNQCCPPRQDNAASLQLTEQASKVLALAKEEAQRLNHRYIGTEHLLLGLIREDGVVTDVLCRQMNVQLSSARSMVEYIIGRGGMPSVGRPQWSPRLEKVIGFSRDEATQLGHRGVGPEHLLLGLVREGQGIGAGVLMTQGVDLEQLRGAVMRAINRNLGQT